MTEDKSFIRSVLLQDSYWILNKTLVRSLGIEAALILSDLLSKEQYFESKGLLSDDGYFFNTLENLTEDTSMPVYAQRKAIKILQDVKLLSVVVKGIPCRQWFKINYGILANFLSFSKSQNLFCENEKLVCSNRKTINNNKINNNKSNSMYAPTSFDQTNMTETVNNIFIRSFGRRALPYEYDDTVKLLERFSADVLVKAFKDGGRDGCRKIKTIISRMDDSGKYIEFSKEQKSNESLSGKRTVYQPDHNKARSRFNDIKNNFG